MDGRIVARGVGVVSIGLGAMLTAAPRQASRLFGIRGYRHIVRLLGVRDLIIGVGLASGRSPRRWTHARAVADAADATLLTTGLAAGVFERRTALPGIGVALGFGALGFWLARRLP